MESRAPRAQASRRIVGVLSGTLKITRSCNHTASTDWHRPERTVRLPQRQGGRREMEGRAVSYTATTVAAAQPCCLSRTYTAAPGTYAVGGISVILFARAGRWTQDPVFTARESCDGKGARVVMNHATSRRPCAGGRRGRRWNTDSATSFGDVAGPPTPAMSTHHPPTCTLGYRDVEEPTLSSFVEPTDLPRAMDDLANRSPCSPWSAPVLRDLAAHANGCVALERATHRMPTEVQRVALGFLGRGQGDSPDEALRELNGTCVKRAYLCVAQHALPPHSGTCGSVALLGGSPAFGDMCTATTAAPLASPGHPRWMERMLLYEEHACLVWRAKGALEAERWRDDAGG